MKKLYWLPTILLLLALVVFVAAHDSLHDAFGVYLIITLCFAVPKLIFVLCDVVLRALHRLVHVPLYHKSVSTVVAVATLGYVLLVLSGVRSTFR